MITKRFLSQSIKSVSSSALASGEQIEGVVVQLFIDKFAIFIT